MDAIVPFSADRPKSRLSTVLTAEERSSFARAMLRDVLDAITTAGGTPRVLATGPVDDLTHRVVVDDRPLTTAVNGVLESGVAENAESDTPSDDSDPIAIVMADVALATPEAVGKLFDAGQRADVVVAPGRGGGTNALVVRHPDFRVDYHGTSYLDHRRAGRAVGATVETIDSFRLATDVDEPTDLTEVLLHTDGRARATLEALGFDLVVRTGRVGLER